MASGQSALLSAMGYKNSPPRRSGNNESVLQDFSMSPYPTGDKTQSRFSSHHNSTARHQSFGVSAQRKRDSPSNQSQAQSSLLWSSPNRPKSNGNAPLVGSSKFSNLPSKSHTISGLGLVSPVPTRFSSSAAPQSKLDISSVSGLVPISPNVHGNGAPEDPNRTLPLTQNLNSTQNTLNFGNETRLSVHQQGGHQLVVAPRECLQHDTQITIIGFPAGEAAYIHRKFAAYGTILKSEWSHNALFIEYESKQNAERALEENAKWISNGNLRYMVAVEYAEKTEMTAQGPCGAHGAGSGGRFMNVTQLYQNQKKGNSTAYFGKNYNEIEKAPDIQNGPTHVFWKIWDFMSSGW